MSTDLDSLMVTQPDDYTTTLDYNTYIESLIPFFRSDSSTRTITLDAEAGYLYRFDFAGLLLENGVALEDHRLVMRVNGFHSWMELDETVRTLLIPNEAQVARFKSIFKTKMAVS